MSQTFPQGHHVFYVIHGIGEQNPFETLDSFTRGLIKELESRGLQFTVAHRLAERTDANGSRWTENFVRVSPQHSADWIDIHEFYWAYVTEAKISVDEVWEWILKTLEGTIRFYKEN